MMIALPPTVHVAIGATLGSVLEGLVSPVVAARDNVLLGPSSMRVRRHRALRARYWKISPFPDLDRELGRLGPIWVYLAPTPSGLLTLCQVCSSAVDHEREIFVIDLGAKPPGESRGTDPDPEMVLDAEEALQHRPPAARWSRLETAFAATLWRLWCRPSPAAFSRFCATGSALHPLIFDLSRYHAGFFPRLAGQTLTLARFDDLLLRQLSGDWSTPAEVFVRAMTARSELGAWLSHTGDLYPATRLLAWSRHTSGRIVERRREHQTNPSALTRWSFRWHPGGEAILEALPRLDAAPSVEIGGAVAYDPDHPWVCRLDATAKPYVSRAGAQRRLDR